jgi:aryl-alcohol dehydrogenase-like predicted oxidoreductase
VPLVGARTRARLLESLGAADVVLTDQQLGKVEAAMPADEVAGERYPTEHMAALDSER